MAVDELPRQGGLRAVVSGIVNKFMQRAGSMGEWKNMLRGLLKLCV